MNILKSLFNFYNYLPQFHESDSRPKIIAFGNVLLDISLKIETTEILQKYNLVLDSQGEIDDEILNSINSEIKNNRFSHVSYGCGGSALNTIRILKKINKNIETIFFGSIGSDENGDKLKNILAENNINAQLQVIETHPTGQCICFILGDKNGLYANIGASSQFSKDYPVKFENIFQPNSNEFKIFYIEGFFIPQRSDVCKFIVEQYVNSSTNILAVNLNSSYIIRENRETLNYLLENATLIFGNKIEYNTLIELMNFESIDQLAKFFCKSSSKKKIIICTSGSDDILLFSNFYSDKMSSVKVPVPKVPENEIKDTTGAGDSFVAGFLESFLSRKSLSESIMSGYKVAGLVVRQIGCNL